MRYDKLTTKFQAALQEAQSQAMANDSGYLEAVHVLQGKAAKCSPAASCKTRSI